MHAMQTEAGTPLTTPDHRHRPRRTLLGIALAVLWVILDQVTKFWAESALELQQPVQVIGDLVRFHLVYNSGAAFSLGTGFTPVLTALSSIISIAVLVILLRARSIPWAITLGLLLGGGVGNLIDRFFRAPGPGVGHVVDFIRFPNFPVFNVADIGVSVAAGLIIVLTLRGLRLDGTREGEAQPGTKRVQAPEADL